MKYFSRKKKKVVYDDVVEYLRCDYCNKKIESGMYYFSTRTGNYDCSYESIESEYKDICEDCINEFTTEYLKTVNKGKEGTDFIEIEKEHFFSSSDEYDEYEDKLVKEDKYN